MSSVDKKEKVASALLDLTERDVLSWKKLPPDAEALSDGLDVSEDGFVFAALHDGMDLFLYSKGEEASDDVQAVLRVNDPESGAGWTFPTLDVIDDLYEFVQFRASGLEKWMEGVLEEASDDSAPGSADREEAAKQGASSSGGGDDQATGDDVDDSRFPDTLHDEEADAENETDPSDDFLDGSDNDVQEEGVFGGGNGQENAGDKGNGDIL